MGRTRNDHAAAAAAARALPGKWTFAGNFPSSLTAKSVARNISSGRLPNYPAYQPAGAWEAYAAPAGDQESVWVRYIGHGEPVAPLPDRMTVRVADRGDGTRGYVGLEVVTVTIAATCAECGGPRGWDTVRPNWTCEDGAWYGVDTWTNGCGHVDMFAAVLREARLRPLPVAPPSRPVEVIG
ncbi:hypothetical protein [Streptomyces sp. NRRL S-350]|uniref:hypothetical protein n=1 Tax=Streptomyces sp. NRRL S-350 TaxID=1463902 RepID=UPI0004BFE0A4|nr:hypothetical protein [Streptomyces sp. NRRL S-350]